MKGTEMESRSFSVNIFTWIFVFTVSLLAIPAECWASNIFVGNIGNGTIEKFTPQGVGQTFYNFNSSGYGPRGLAFDSSGNLYVTNDANNTIDKFLFTGGVLSNQCSVFVDSGLSNPIGLTFDGGGNLYVVNNNYGEIMKYTSTGGVLSNVATVFANMSTAGVLAFDNSGNLFVGSGSFQGINKFTSTGGVLSNVPTFFSSSDGPTWGLAVDSNRNVYAALPTANEIEKFTPAGVGTVFATNGLDWPSGLAFDSNGNLFVTNVNNGTIMEFISTGGTLSNVGSVFASPGMITPQCIAVQVIPEPATLSLMALGGVALIRRRK
jgi:glucose/arabinose dehydrogenase